jgi:hypothetical protein
MIKGLIFGLFFISSTAIAAAQTPSPAQRAVPRPARPASASAVPADGQVVPRYTRESALGTVQGNALDSFNRALPDALVRLRDARLGRIVNTQVTDRAGLFQFRSVDPGNYVVELVIRETVQAASQLIGLNAGETASAVVKLPGRSPLGGVLGHTTSQIAVVTAAAAATGVLGAAATTDVSSDGTN